jgi:hypothetical protein
MYVATKYKRKVVPVLKEDVWGSGGVASPFLISALDGSAAATLPLEKISLVPTG